jgi:hypothetical protein
MKKGREGGKKERARDRRAKREMANLHKTGTDETDRKGKETTSEECLAQLTVERESKTAHQLAAQHSRKERVKGRSRLERRGEEGTYTLRWKNGWFSASCTPRRR